MEHHWLDFNNPHTQAHIVKQMIWKKLRLGVNLVCHSMALIRHFCRRMRRPSLWHRSSHITSSLTPVFRVFHDRDITNEDKMGNLRYVLHKNIWKQQKLVVSLLIKMLLLYFRPTTIRLTWQNLVEDWPIINSMVAVIWIVRGRKTWYQSGTSQISGKMVRTFTLQSI